MANTKTNETYLELHSKISTAEDTSFIKMRNLLMKK